MTNQASGTLNLCYTLLIGIDCYLPNRLPNGGSYPSLGGCVRDITLVEEFLKRTIGLPNERILKLTATNTGAVEPPEPREQWPTYERMVAAFRQLTEIAQPGSQVYIHYSGHGGRMPTRFPELKGAHGLDEALVPLDIGDSTARYLRDMELAHILKMMVDKELIVTLVLDSCHSGGATRGAGGAAVRGVDTIDTTLRPTQSLVAPDDALASTWRSLTQGASRTLILGSGWLPEPQGYILLAACRPSEAAYEYSFDGKERHGVLTYWLLDSLKQIGPGLTYKQLHDRIIAKVHTQFERQTPQLQGESSRIVLGSDHAPAQYAVNVLSVDPTSQRILLNTGQVHTVRTGALFAIFPPGVTDFTQLDKRQALVEIAELGATNSWAKITKQLRLDPIEQGAQAVLLDLGTMRLCRTVRLVHQESLPLTIDQGTALNHIERAVVNSESGFVTMAAADEPADYQVAINADGAYEIWDPAGQPFANLRPALRIDDSGAATRLVQRLVHLTKYHNIQQLDNVDPLSPLAYKLVVELAGVQAVYDPVDPPNPQPFNGLGNTPTLQVGEWTFVRIKNASSQVLNVTVLDLQPDWGITQVYPSSHDTLFWPFDPGQEQLIPLRTDLPSGYTAGRDVIKVFATIGATNFRWLELPALDQPSMRNASIYDRPTNPLEELLAAVTTDEPKIRHLNVTTYPSREWTVAQVEVWVQRARSEVL